MDFWDIKYYIRSANKTLDALTNNRLSDSQRQFVNDIMGWISIYVVVRKLFDILKGDGR